ncbi:MAG: KamA family radical SAM protein [Chloroflexi bacterium]|nr:KamA family radical SAM protein [Chloroflexota bacterium]
MATSMGVQVSSEAREEPPHAVGSATEEPPGKRARENRQRFFGHVSEEQWNDWKWQFRNRINTVRELAHFIRLSDKEQARLRLVTGKYPFSITPYYFCLIDQNNPDDPVRKQTVPSFDEIAFAFMGEADPLAEEEDSVVPGLVHRYPDRVLMVLTNICPVLCRHCTRKREWQSGRWAHTDGEIELMLDYIRRNKVVRDVIISGGDPLSLATSRLEEVISRVRAIPHVEIIRIGTRFPVVLPQRIDAELCAMLSKYGPIWINTHFNHPDEVTPESALACDRLVRSGVPLNNQSVLLRGVNDSVETQTKLCRELLKIKVRPYYLFHADEVQGTEHLRTTIETGIQIIEGMRGHTSGLAIPTFVVDLPGGGGKVPLQPNYLVSKTDGEFVLRNYEGRTFTCRDPEPWGADRRPDTQQHQEQVQPASREAVAASKGRAK